MYGGVAGAHSIDFALRGEELRWGRHDLLDSVVAAGVVDHRDGVALEELSLTTGGGTGGVKRGRDVQALVWAARQQVLLSSF